MTASVIITSPSPNHKRVRVGLCNRTRRAGVTPGGASMLVEGEVIILAEGESSRQLYLHDGVELSISEVD